MRKQGKHAIAYVVIALIIIVAFGEGYAAAPKVKLVVNPKNREVYAGSGRVAITVESPGKDLTFIWELSGPGTLEGRGAARFYIPPETIDEKSVRATVTVAVKDKAGQETKKSVTITILPNPLQSPITSPGAEPTAKRGLSKTTMVALGAGAVAAFAGGIALASGGDGDGAEQSPMSTPTPEPTPTPACTGDELGGACWHLGPLGQSCHEVCAPRGGYDEATRTYAGSEGTVDQCEQVLELLDAPPNEDPRFVPYNNPCGCYVWVQYAHGIMRYYWHRAVGTTTAECAGSERRRACACNW